MFPSTVELTHSTILWCGHDFLNELREGILLARKVALHVDDNQPGPLIIERQRNLILDLHDFLNFSCSVIEVLAFAWQYS